MTEPNAPPGPPATHTPAWPSLLLPLGQALVIIVAATVIFWPALHGSWLWDDYIDISQSRVTVSGNGLWSIWFVPGSQADYYPVKATVQWVQWHLWGENTLGYHVTNLVLHIVGSLLVWWFFRKLRLKLAWLGGLIFAIHPAQVESVAWVAELKNTLSMPFFLLAAGFYLDYDAKGRRGDYLAALALFLVAMLTKPSMVMFPVVILLYAWWKRGRIGVGDLKASAPFFLVSLLIGLLTLQMVVWVQEAHHAIAAPIPLGGVLSRLALAGLSLSFYLLKALLPIGLLPIYQQWPVDPPSLIEFLPWVAFAVIFAVCWSKRGSWGRHLLFGLGFFLIMLLPFAGFIGANYMRFTWVMDHFLYLPILGVIGLVIAGLERLERRLALPARDAGRVILAMVLVLLALSSCNYAAQFVDEMTLWSYTLQGNPSAWPAHVNYGNALVVQGRYEDAIHEYQETLRLHPGYAQAETDWGTTLFLEGRPEEAIEHFKRAAEFDPIYFDTFYDWGAILVKTGHPDQALPLFEHALKLDPDSIAVRNYYGVALMELGRKAEALAQFQEALRLDPTNQLVRNNLKSINHSDAASPGK
jgi:hypothetical protein